MARLSFVLLLVLFTASCLVRSQVTVFHDFEPNIKKTKYIVLATEEQKNSLEHRSYEKLVKQQLDLQGFKEVPLDEADVVVMFSYGDDGGRQIVSSYPIFGQTGVSSSNTYGTVQSYGNSATYSGTTNYTPSYGIVGSGVSSRTEYKRFLYLSMIDHSASKSGDEIKRIYEGKVVSNALNSNLPEAVPVMIKALFKEFPGESGKVRTVDVLVE